ncbi:MAG: bifunctional NAD(P)H-hydrate repair enzyme [Acidimicrobiia bacterium]|nr:MAG: bifunctional NAD(P)H-hydrate repair enzyme [Acidimicrobiia bacterium]
MEPVLTPAEMADADARAIAAGTPFEVLVERAGGAAARAAVRMLGGTYGRRVVVLCGRGNNGADGLVAARRLRAAGCGVDVFRVLDSVDGVERAAARADLAVDAMFGTGFRGALDGDPARAAAAVAGLPTLSVDIPSGVDGATGEVRGRAVVADETVCFAALKPGLLFEPGRSHAGTVRVVDIGIDVSGPGGAGAGLAVLDAGDLWLPRRGATDHKWSHALLVVGGSLGMTGAPSMVARAAARCGAGMVVAALPGAEAARLAAGPEVVVRALPATPEGGFDEDAGRVVLKDLHRFHAVCIGPGLGRDERAHAAARRVVAEAPVPVVVDADALNALAVDPAALRVRVAAGLPPAVLTPHAGEYERLAGRAVGPDRVEAARHLARVTGGVVCLKGPGTVVAAPDGRAVVNRTDGPALATAGTGDVLAGIVGGLLANGADPFTAAATAADLQGRAAAEAGTGAALVAMDLIDALPRTLDTLRRGAGPGED